MFLQPSTIKEIDFSSAFTQQYIENLRNEATRMGDQLMRVLLTSTENFQEVVVTEKTELKCIMPDSTGNCVSGSSRLLVMETVIPKSSDVSNMRRQRLTFGNWPDQAIRSESGHQLDERFSGTSVNNLATPSLTQEVMDLPSTTFSGHRCEKLSFSERVDSAAYPPLIQAVRDDQRAAVSGHHSNKQCASEGGMIPVYPPLVQAVTGDHLGPVIGHHHNEQLSSKSASNPAYPSFIQAVRSDQSTTVPGHQTENPSSSEGVANPDISPFNLALRDSSPRQVAKEKCSCGRKSNAPDSLLKHAFRDDQLTPAAIGQNAVGQWSSQRGSNLTCQPFMRAVRDNPAPPASANNATNVHQEQLEPLEHVLLSCKQLKIISRQHSWDTKGLKNSFQLQEEAIDHILLSCKRSEDRSGEHLPNEVRSNPAYPSLMQAVRDDPPKSIPDHHQSNEHVSSGTCSNPSYPPLMEAVRKDLPTRGTFYQSGKYSSSVNGSNLAYPSLDQAVRNDS